MQERVILHCDLNNYFASVECIDHPQWRQIPMAVCGSKQERHGIVLAKNELAKAAGVKTAMTVVEAKRLCPHLLTVPPHYEKYVAYSKQVQALYSCYTDQVEPFGIDECWLDVTGSRLLFGSGEEIAQRLRKEVKERFSLTISVGVSFCKVMAKLGSDLKKPDAVTVIYPRDLPQKVWPLAVTDLFGVGRRTAEKLKAMGIFTIGQLAAASPELLKSRFGKNGYQLWQFANGWEYAPVRQYGDADVPKSISRSMTCGFDLETAEQIQRVLVGLAEQVSTELRKDGVYAGTVHLYLRDQHLNTYQCQAHLQVPTRLVRDLTNAAMTLLPQLWNGIPLRAVGIGAENLLPQSAGLQTGLFFDINRMERVEQLEAGIDLLRERMGCHTISRASQLRTPLRVRHGSSFGHTQF